MTAGVVTVSGIKYAAGLYWQPSPDAKIARAARAAAKQPGFQTEFYCVRPPTKSQPIGQFGLGLAAANHKVGMPALAGCLASQVPGSWAGAFRVNEGIFFIAVRDDLVDADGDAWFAHDDDGQSRLEQEIARGGLHHIYAPPEWGVHGTEIGSLPTMLTGRRDITLQSVSLPRSYIFIGLAILIVGGLSYGAYAYLQAEAEKRAAEEAAAAAARAKAQHALVPGVEYPKTWQDSPRPMEYIHACEKALENISAVYLGWTSNSIQCNGSSLSVAWTRSGQTYAEVPAAGKAVLDPALSSANTSLPLDHLTPRGTEALAYYGLVDQHILYHNWPVHLTALPDDVVTVPKDSPPPPPPQWRKRAIVYNVKGAPWLQPKLFDGLPGLIITSIKEATDGNYTIEGTIYENKQP